VFLYLSNNKYKSLGSKKAPKFAISFSNADASFQTCTPKSLLIILIKS